MEYGFFSLLYRTAKKPLVRFFMSQAELLQLSFSGVALLYFLSLWSELKIHPYTHCEVQLPGYCK